MGGYNFGSGVPTWNGVPMIGISSPGIIPGLWSKHVLFVDGDNGSDGNHGISPQKAFKTIQKAIDMATLEDTIYIRPMYTALGWDTLYQNGAGLGTLTGTYVENTSVTALTKNGLSIIGTGNGTGVTGKAVQMGGVVSVVSPTIDIKSPFVNVENINFAWKAAQATTASPVIRVISEGTTGYAFGCSIINCGFEISNNAEGTIRNDGAFGMTIEGCTFRNVKVSIYLASLDHTIDCVYIRRNVFMASAVTNISGCIVAGTVYNLNILDNKFNHGTPNATGYKKYIYCAGVVSGGVQGNMFGVTGSSLGAINTLSNLTGGGNFDLAGAMTT